MKVLIVSSYDKGIFPHLDTVTFFDYLVKEVGVIKDDIIFYGRAEIEAKIDFYSIFGGICEKTMNQPLVIYYSGHGFYDGWDLSKKIYIPYEVMAHFLQARSAPLILINDCCFGMAATNALKNLKYNKLIIGLAPKDLEGQSDHHGSFLLPDVFKYWRKYISANPRFKFRKSDLPESLQGGSNYKAVINSCLRYGDNLDYILFPEKSIDYRLYRVSQLILKIMQLFWEIVLTLKKSSKSS